MGGGDSQPGGLGGGGLEGGGGLDGFEGFDAEDGGGGRKGRRSAFPNSLIAPPPPSLLTESMSFIFAAKIAIFVFNLGKF